MNYGENRKLKEDLASLNDRLYELFREVRGLEQSYRWESENLADRLAGKMIADVGAQLGKLVETVNETTYLFKD